MIKIIKTIQNLMIHINVVLNVKTMQIILVIEQIILNNLKKRHLIIISIKEIKIIMDQVVNIMILEHQMIMLVGLSIVKVIEIIIMTNHKDLIIQKGILK